MSFDPDKGEMTLEHEKEMLQWTHKAVRELVSREATRNEEIGRCISEEVGALQRRLEDQIQAAEERIEVSIIATERRLLDKIEKVSLASCSKDEYKELSGSVMQLEDAMAVMERLTAQMGVLQDQAFDAECSRAKLTSWLPEQEMLGCEGRPVAQATAPPRITKGATVVRVDSELDGDLESASVTQASASVLSGANASSRTPARGATPPSESSNSSQEHVPKGFFAPVANLLGIGTCTSRSWKAGFVRKPLEGGRNQNCLGSRTDAG